MSLQNEELIKKIRDTPTTNEKLAAGEIVGMNEHDPIKSSQRSVSDRILAKAILELDARLQVLEKHLAED